MQATAAGYATPNQSATMQRQASTKKPGLLARPITLPPAAATAENQWQESIYDVTEVQQQAPPLPPKVSDVKPPAEEVEKSSGGYVLMNPAANPLYGNLALPPKARQSAIYDATEAPSSPKSAMQSELPPPIVLRSGKGVASPPLSPTVHHEAGFPGSPPALIRQASARGSQPSDSSSTMARQASIKTNTASEQQSAAVPPRPLRPAQPLPAEAQAPSRSPPPHMKPIVSVPAPATVTVASHPPSNSPPRSEPLEYHRKVESVASPPSIMSRQGSNKRVTFSPTVHEEEVERFSPVVLMVYAWCNV
jgi:hypothetical protein